ncbi:MAG: hypothetical protein VKP62_02285 [Candidatus Sericytochromatia bacterium]|nr:hypothetical protein [Candidatus Sericytochromatia bacterium]
MKKPKSGGYAEYDDPDFDSEWFDDEAYDRVVDGAYEEEPLDERAAARSGAAARGTDRGVGARAAGPDEAGPRTSPLAIAVGGMAAVVLAAGAGYYLMASVVGGPAERALGDYPKRVQRAWAVLVGQPLPAPSPEPTPLASDVLGVAPVDGPGEEPDTLASASEMSTAPAPALRQPTQGSGAPPALETPLVAPSRTPLPSSTPQAGPAVQASMAPLVALRTAVPLLSPTPASPLPSKPSQAAVSKTPSPATLPTTRPSPGGATPRLPTTASKAPARKGPPVTPAVRQPEKLVLEFAPGVVVLTGPQVEALWSFSGRLENAPGRLVVQAQPGFGRLAPGLAQGRVNAVAALLRRHTGGTGVSVEVKLLSTPVAGLAGRRVEVHFQPAPSTR